MLVSFRDLLAAMWTSETGILSCSYRSFHLTYTFSSSGGVLTDDGELNLAVALRRQPMLVVPGKVNGLHVSWFVYRGPGQVTFDPLQIEVWEDTRPYSNYPWSLGWANPEPPEDGRWVVQVTFDEPGTYVLRGLVDDGGLSVYRDVTVEVTPLTLQ
jgi:hypothetical protein